MRHVAKLVFQQERASVSAARESLFEFQSRVDSELYVYMRSAVST
jgi:hypothetical protein